MNRWARSAPTMRPLCAYYAPDMSINRFGVEPMGPSWPTMRPLCTHYVQKPFCSRPDGPKMRPLCAHYVHKPFMSGTVGPKVRPLCAHNAPTRRPLCPITDSESNRGAQCAPAKRPLSAINRRGGEPTGRKGAHNAPTHYKPTLPIKPLWSGTDGPTVRPLCAHYFHKPF